MTLPTVSPAERFYPALTAANTARADAAGGDEHIITNADVDKAIAAANDADRQALRTAQRRCSDLRRDLDRAELAAAASFAAADSRPVEHVLAQQADLETELRLLAAAGRYHAACRWPSARTPPMTRPVRQSPAPPSYPSPSPF